MRQPSYSERLAKRFRAARQAYRATDPSGQNLPGAIDSTAHPGRYPRHPDPAKGQVFAGTCNTTRCTENNAVFFNRGTFGLYCVRCAQGQNACNSVPLCVRVEAKPTLEVMDRMAAQMMQEMSQRQGR